MYAFNFNLEPNVFEQHFLGFGLHGFLFSIIIYTKQKIIAITKYRLHT